MSRDPRATGERIGVAIGRVLGKLTAPLAAAIVAWLAAQGVELAAEDISALYAAALILAAAVGGAGVDTAVVRILMRIAARIGKQ